MLADPQSITYNGVATSLAAIARGESTSKYMDTDGIFSLTVGHDFRPQRNRFTVNLGHRKISEDPYNTSLNKPFDMRAYLVIDMPVVGFSNVEARYLSQALVDYLDVSGFLAKVLGGET